MLKVQEVTFRYGHKQEAAVEDLSFQAGERTICGLLGPNGAGKTTAIQLILGLLNPDRGMITLNGLSLSDDPLAYKKEIGYVSGSQRIYDSLTGKEYLNFMADMYGITASRRKEVYEPLIENFQLQPHLNKLIRSCSHGTQQKLFIMASIVHSPKLWILDEPQTGLDVEAAFVLKRLMKRHAELGNAVLFASHLMEVCEQICDKVVIIKKGRILHTSNLHSSNQKSLEQLYLEVTRQHEHAAAP